MNSKIDIIAYCAGAIGVITSIPQLHQIIITKQVRDLNPYFFILHSTSDLLYLIYGVFADDYILSISMSFPFTCNVIIFILWVIYTIKVVDIEKEKQQFTEHTEIKIDEVNE
tara:strand:+ start:296 stop:631 length:336 start_codon:yes stop_codon:yes gene_type:complete